MPGRDFLMQRGGWYGISMFPGYFDVPYHSPIRVDALNWLEVGGFRMEFLNLAYAAGVQQFDMQFKPLKNAPEFLVAEPVDQHDRLYIFTRLTRNWMSTYFPRLARDALFDQDGMPNERAFLALN